MYYLDYDPFVLPFTLGALALVVILLSKFFRWWDRLESEDRMIIRTGLRAGKTLKILKEVFLESLIHRKMFRQNPLLGYMHMTFAFGWFMLILLGNLESRLYSGIEFNLPFYPIFFKFFVHDKSIIPFSAGFTFFMDFFLLLVITGFLLAVFKRLNTRIFGMKRPTHPEPIDRIALTALWFIFPLRLLAESFTSGSTGTGGFLTGSLGRYFAGFLPVELMAYPAWWSYSIALGVFFVTLPYSRYMHIPSEVLLIFMRNLGYRTGRNYNFFSEVEVNSCPSCGVCIETCQLKTILNHDQIVPAYFLRKLKRDKPVVQALEECLLCGRCQQVCPVSIDVNDIRLQRRKEHYKVNNPVFSFIESKVVAQSPPVPSYPEVVYFAGCMTHLTPGIKKAMETILSLSGVSYLFIDKEGGVCCGRPLQMAGQWDAAKQLVDINRKLIQDTHASVFVTSCPICLKVFKEEYNLKMEVLHHSQYILRLMESGKIKPGKQADTAVFHDPCELGRGCGIYDEPRTVINSMAELKGIRQEKDHGLCCGGSLGSFSLSSDEKRQLRNDTLYQLLVNQPDYLVTACPLCKKTLSPATQIPVVDIAELIVKNLKFNNIAITYQLTE
ncbi:MAG: (Fe-S)-binding protein [Bacteroidetes bacterium]|nr:(Fe-S)-binding protein [Bacteroidota bacterium]